MTLIFCLSAAGFTLANGAMLLLVANHVTQQSGRIANLFVSAATVSPQIVVAVISPWIGRAADRAGRKPLLLLGCAASCSPQSPAARSSCWSRRSTASAVRCSA